MKGFLAFSKEFEVKKTLTKENFLRSANLTNVERKTLISYIRNLNILYDITFLDNSEMIVLEIELNHNDRGNYGLNNLVIAIAQSLPYHCMLLVREEGVVRLFSFKRKENKFDDCRTRVLDVCSSSEMIPIQNDVSDEIMIKELRDAIMKSTSAKELNWEWNKILKNSGFVIDSFEYSLDTYHQLVEKKERLESIIERDHAYEFESDCIDEYESDIFDGAALGKEQENDEEIYISFCAANARTLYEEASDITEWQEEDWLKHYIIACNDYSNQIFVKSINSKIAKRIVSAFWEETDEEDFSDVFDVDELKEHIGEEYFSRHEG